MSFLDGNLNENKDPGEAVIFITKNGPCVVTGGPVLEVEDIGKRATKDDFTLCRCGGSKNKPFCDGTHWYINFEDDKN